MTSARITPNPRPMAAELPLLPMSKDDARFWALLRARRANPTNRNGKDAA
ncbi:hypothetical protein [Novosphingobium sp. 28-62-57]|nr:hypothetical protein [Novosphingobium sp. 28-62-57]HQS98624.1 hypothetical protein [Novosphingobium sp.]